MYIYFLGLWKDKDFSKKYTPMGVDHNLLVVYFNFLLYIYTSILYYFGGSDRIFVFTSNMSENTEATADKDKDVRKPSVPGGVEIFESIEMQ